MKKVLLILIFGIIAQNLNAQGRVSGRLLDCKNNFTVNDVDIKLVKGDSIVGFTKSNKKGKFKFKNIKKGNYLLCYKSKYDLETRKSINIDSRDVLKIELCYENLAINKDTIRTPFRHLTIQDSIVIKFVSSGCFHLKTEKVIITKQVNSFELIHFENDSLIKLTSAKNIVDKLDDLLIEGTINMFSTNNVCTTTHIYSIFVNGQLIQGALNNWKLIDTPVLEKLEYPITLLDGSCDWYGFSNFKSGILE